ncbi:Phr family secreted Rap phosphatase inhibitor [Bacillus pseudomycoides]|uniref:Phr family secreted Rap phosphatase inhibitor n=1 Tax=Bacillus pseudomycoides TaxID=64104 RepID=UPI001FB1B9E7|nr:Phr family secreted Rap phosphatase inhibitor [Bacillus pseudomycoides]
MKKISGLATFVAITGILTVGLNTFTPSSHYLNRGDTGGAPARPEYVNIGDTAPADNRGDGGGAPSNSHADLPAPKEI